MRGCYIGNNRVLVGLTWGGKLIVNANDLSLAPDLIINGVYDVPLTNFMIKNIKHNQIFVDVGANMGLFTVLAGYLVGESGKVFSFEANEQHCSLIRENLAMNYLTAQSVLYNVAAYSEQSRLTFHATERFMGNGSLLPHDQQYRDRYNIETFHDYEVDAVTLDSVLSNVEYLDYIKIDVEGGEYHVFRGMNNLLKNHRVGTVVFELNKNMLGDIWFDFYNELCCLRDEHHYEFSVLNQEGDLVAIDLQRMFEFDEIPAVVMKRK